MCFQYVFGFVTFPTHSAFVWIGRLWLMTGCTWLIVRLINSMAVVVHLRVDLHDVVSWVCCG